MRARRRTAILGALVLLFSPLVASPALAHAEFAGGEPGAGETLAEGPSRVRVAFTEPVEGEFDPLRVTARDGRRVDGRDARISPGDARVLEASLRDLPPGAYEVEYRVTSLDGHVISGSYEFEVARERTAPRTVGEGSPVEGTDTTEETTVERENTEEPLPETEPAGGGTGSLGTYAAAAVAVTGLAILALAALRARRNR